MSIRVKKAIVFPCHKRAPRIQGYERKQDMWYVSIWLLEMKIVWISQMSSMQKAFPPDFLSESHNAWHWNYSVCKLQAT